MRRFVITGAALMLVMGGIMGCKKEETTSQNEATPGEKTANAVSNAGQATGNALGKAVDATNDAAKAAADKLKSTTQPSADTAIKDTRSTLASAVQDAVTDNDLNKLISYFAKGDRARIGTIDKTTLGPLNAVIDAFRADWKAKYNQDFKLSDKQEVVFGGPVQIKPGDTADAARLASGNPREDNPSVNNVTIVSFPGSAGVPAVTLRLVNEGMVMKEYRIDVPNSLDGNTLRDNLAKQIQAIDGAKAQWPADVNEAYRTVAQHILAVIENK